MITPLTIIETSLISLAFGVSTMAVVSYIFVAKYGYPRKGISNALIQSQYKILRCIHIILGVIVVANLIIFGILDKIPASLLEYTGKACVLLLAVGFSISMEQRIFSVKAVAPLIAAAWYTLAFHNTISLTVGTPSLLHTLLLYILFAILLLLLFRLIDYYYSIR